ncbi:MAG: leucine-rich repeat domain-containing protein [Verrucomicrobia bacterium]|nr:leucine-rich repeat domain-containing protein [Verrucomicrobiota bacterium]
MKTLSRLTFLLLGLFAWIPMLLGQGTFNASNNYTPAGSSTKAFIFDFGNAPYPKAKGRVAIRDQQNRYLSPNGDRGVGLTLDGLFFINGLVLPGVPAGSPGSVILYFWDVTTGETYDTASIRAFALVNLNVLGGGETPASTFAVNSDFKGLRVNWDPPPTSFSFRLENGAAVLERVAGSREGILRVPDQYQGFPVTKIDDQAISNSSFYQIHLPATLREIGARAFSRCSGLMGIVIPEGVTNLGVGAFEYCRNLTTVVLPTDLRILPSELFSQCVQLQVLSLPPGLTTIQPRAFSGTSLKSLTLPSRVREIGREAFEGCLSLEAIGVAEGHPTLASVDGVLLARSLNRIVHYPPARRGLFSIPWGLENIESHTFAGVAGLSEIEIPPSVTNISVEAFVGCPLTYVSIPGSVTTVGAGAFRGCPLKGIELQEGIQTLGRRALFECPQLTEVRFPASLVTLDHEALAGCTSLRRADFRGGRAIGTGAFQGCTRLAEVQFPETLRSVGALAFAECPAMRRVVFPAETQTLGALLFRGCTQLSEIILPRSLTRVPSFLLAGCTGLTRIDLPDPVATIEASAFAGCVNLREVGLHAVKEISSWAFVDCVSLTEVHLPATLERIERDAFQGCEQLTSIFFEGSPPSGAVDLRIPDTTALYRLFDSPSWGSFRHPNGTRDWSPAVAVELDPGGNGALTLRAHWAEGKRVVWQTSQRLEAEQWEPVSTNQMVLRTSTLVDTSPAQAKRWYRVVSADP